MQERIIGDGQKYRTDNFMSVTDECDNHVSEGRYGDRRRRAPEPNQESLKAHVRAVSAKIPALEAVNGRYGKFFNSRAGRTPAIGPVWVPGSAAARHPDRMALLRSIAREDVCILEAAAAWLVDIPAQQARYYAEFSAAFDGNRTPSEAVGPGYDYAEFYLAERDMAYGLQRSGEPDPDGACCTCNVHWNAVAEWNAKHPGQHLVSMDPPWGTHRISFSLQELDEGIVYGRSVGRGPGISVQRAADVVANAGGCCELCGRTGVRLEARSLIVFEDIYHDDGEGGRDGVFDGDLLIRAMCPDCARRWRREFFRIKSDDEFLREFGMLWRAFPVGVEATSDAEYGARFRAAVDGLDAKVRSFCKAHVSDEDWISYTPGAAKDGFGRDASFRELTSDERQVLREDRHPVKCWIEHEQFEWRWNRRRRIGNWFRRMLTAMGVRLSQPLEQAAWRRLAKSRSVAREETPACHPERLAALSALNDEILSRAHDIPFFVDVLDADEEYGKGFRSSGWPRLKAWIEAHPDDIAYLADFVAGNRALADEYDERFRSAVVSTRKRLEAQDDDALYAAYDAMDKACRDMYRTFPVGCYIVTTNRAVMEDRTLTTSFACSIERACEIAGLGQRLGKYAGGGFFRGPVWI